MIKNLLINTLFLASGMNLAQAQNTWTQKADFGGTGIAAATGFSIGSKGYIGTGSDFYNYLKGFWEYDPPTDAWTQKADVGGTGRDYAVGFSIGNKGYIGTGEFFDGSFHFYNDFWEYDPLSNEWEQKADFGGAGRANAVGFSIGNKGYIGTGYFYDGSDHYFKDFWEYDPDTDAWTQKADFGGTARFSPVGFSIGDKGYVGTGFDTSEFPDYLKKDFWEYDPAINSWKQKADFGGTARYVATGFSINSKGYIGTGWDGFGTKKDFWEYDVATNAWTQKADYGGNEIVVATGFSIGSKGYIGTGNTFDGYKKDLWEYTPGQDSNCGMPTTFSTVNITSNSATLAWLGIDDAIIYKVRYRIKGASGWTTARAIVNHKTLHTLQAATEYVWQVKSICSVQPFVSSEWSEKQFFTTDDLKLSEQTDYEQEFAIHPNPVSSSATVIFYLNEASAVTIELIDLNGRTVSVLTNKNFLPGKNEITFDRGSISAGIYFLQMKTSAGVMRKKLELIN